MRKMLFISFGFGICLIAMFVYFSMIPTGSAQRNVRLQWEYAAIKAAYTFNPVKNVNRVYGMAEICYLQTDGCRRDEVKHDFDYVEYLQKLGNYETSETRKQAGLKAAEIAFQKAMTQLGNEGWEIIGEPALSFEFIDIETYNRNENKSQLFIRPNTQAVYFKRLKIQ